VHRGSCHDESAFGGIRRDQPPMVFLVNATSEDGRVGITSLHEHCLPSCGENTLLESSKATKQVAASSTALSCIAPIPGCTGSQKFHRHISNFGVCYESPSVVACAA
jgi:hypothetical protein